MQEIDDKTVLIVTLCFAAIIIVLALVLARFTRGSARRDRRYYDTNADRGDGRGTATWIGADEATDRDLVD